MSDYLASILERKKHEVAKLPLPMTFKRALQQSHLAVIAEIKRSSPSKGALSLSLDPVQLAKQYIAGGAAAISVLTDEAFGGSLDDLRAVVTACPGIPILRKDFIIDEKQLYETARAGAQAVLLIVAVLQERLKEFISIARNVGLETLVEVHTEVELVFAQQAGAEIIGINNRDLTTFVVSLETTCRLAPQILPAIVTVAESGIHTRADAEKMRTAGCDAILVGEALVKSDHPEQLIREFCQC